jgi:hyperosmotically inducible protein
MAKKMILVACLLSLGGFATAANTKTTTSTTAKEVNNTKVNQRDANMDTLTPEDQSKGTTADVDVTRRIRQGLVADKNLSTDAQNIKIITLNGIVTLRGPVNTPSEKQRIDALAKKTAGAKRIDNQIEVKTRVE